MRRRRSAFIAMILLLSAAARPSAEDAAGLDRDRPGAPVFEQEIVPILRTYCWKCHGGEGRTAELDLRSLPLLLKGGQSGPVLEPGSAAGSLLFQKLAAGEMPPGNELKPTPEHVEQVRRWIDAGAAGRDQGGPLTRADDPPVEEGDRGWWAFRPPVRPPVPPVEGQGRVRTPIDAFVLSRLEEQGLSLSPEADRVTLIRRLAFDLTGLPPEPDAVEAYLADARPDADARLVERLLASPHYGERWGRHWLDAAGYVDTIGSDNDATIIEPREGIWQYRDYVIRAFNDDKPYDEFVREQLSGDELVDWRNATDWTAETRDLLIATGFLRQAADVTYAPELNTADIRHQVLYDTLQIVSSNLLGLTVHCAQCHTHKFDPISHADYFRLAAVFAPAYNVQDWKHSKERVLADLPPARQREIDEHNARIDGQIQELQRRIDEANASDDDSTKAQVPEWQERVAALTAQRRSYGTLPVLWDVGPPPPAYLYRRGDYQAPGPAVRPGVPAVLDDPQAPFTIAEPPAGSGTSGYRTALAGWLTRPDHPLTARVIVNRVWQQYFGRGIVATPDNFGRSGAQPTHPELLDWLAVEFVESGWSFKRLHRLIVASSVYRQQSKIGPPEDSEAEEAVALPSVSEAPGSTAAGVDPQAVDPANTLLWRMPLRRLESEAVRDSMLAVSGALDRRLGGPPVPLKPHADGRVEIDAENLASPQDQFRRSVYVFARRNYQLTELAVFDQPHVAHNCTRRSHSAVALQPLTLLNSEFVFEQAERFAARVSELAGADEDARIEWAFRLALARPPGPDEWAIARELLTRQSGRYETQDNLPPERAAAAALENLCQMLLNASEFLYIP